VGLAWRLTDLLVLGERAAANDVAATCAQWAVELRQRAHRWYATHCQATLALLDGRIAAVEGMISKALTFNPQVHDQSASQTWAIQMYALRREQGRLGEMEPVMVPAAELYGAVPAWRAALASLYADTGRDAECRAEFERLAEDGFRGLPHDGNWLTAAAYATRSCTHLGDAQRAALLYDHLRPYRRLNIVTGLAIHCLGSVELYLGMLAGTTARWDEADDHFESARAMHSRLRSPPWHAHTDYEQARVMIARGRVEDRARAHKLLARAGATADALDMTRLSERVRAGAALTAA
jgi:hypothetical protein